MVSSSEIVNVRMRKSVAKKRKTTIQVNEFNRMLESFTIVDEKNANEEEKTS